MAQRAKTTKSDSPARRGSASRAGVARSGTTLVSPKEHVAAGKALRDTVAREQLGIWKPGRHRANPLAILRRSDANRLKELLPIRYGRMLASPFAFYRGTADIMASDLSHAPTTGQFVQACGDCHLMNFGGFATPERKMIFDINDFDETHPAPWDWDVRRLAASVVLAGRSIGLSDRKSRDCAASAARSYREHIRVFSEMDPLRVWYSVVGMDEVAEVMPVAAVKRLQKRIAKETTASGSEIAFPKLTDTLGGHLRISEQPPLIFHPDVAQEPGFEQIIEKVFRDYRETLAADRRALLDHYQPVDAAIKVVGVGSVGRRCWVALLMSAGNSPLFLQFKEAAQSVLEPFTKKSVYRHHGERIVAGQRLMQPVSDIFLGWVAGPTGRQFYVRQLRDAKIKPLVETFDATMLDLYAGMCGHVLARAHSKASMISSAISGYLGASSDRFDEAMGDFAVAYADQAERDYTAFKGAVRKGQIAVVRES